ncbi:hypothetical protein [Streptomyces sp. NPDC056160]|uniref:hypothetical protein n=1 Tax=Streptomyces sp. NPDC056160 TaxID=3345731 RepID=UPI0035D9DED4
MKCWTDKAYQGAGGTTRAPEGAEQEGGFTDRGQAFAAYVTDQQAGGVVGAGCGGEVAADLGLFLGGQTAAGDLQCSDTFRAGAITRSGPRRMLVGEWTSATVMSTISAIGIDTSHRFCWSWSTHRARTTMHFTVRSFHPARISPIAPLTGHAGFARHAVQRKRD